MAFKLGSENRDFNTPNKQKFSRKEMVGETPIIRKSLGEGVKGEANSDGSIYISVDIEPNSAEERNTLIHEMRHATDMKIGKLGYDDNYVYWNGAKFPRENGFIHYFDQKLEEGDVRLPWEPNI